MERTDARRRYREPMLYVAIGSACSAVARAVGVLWVAIPLLAAALVCLVIGAVAPLVFIAVLAGVLLLFVDE